MAGNVYDWTLEAVSTSSRVLRGGSFNSYGSSSPVRYRSNNVPSDSYNDYGCRGALYIKQCVRILNHCILTPKPEQARKYGHILKLSTKPEGGREVVHMTVGHSWLFGTMTNHITNINLHTTLQYVNSLCIINLIKPFKPVFLGMYLKGTSLIASIVFAKFLFIQ